MLRLRNLAGCWKAFMTLQSAYAIQEAGKNQLAG